MMKFFAVTTFDPSLAGAPPTQEEMDRMDQLIQDCKRKGELIETGGRFPGMLEFKLSRKNGDTTVTDGPFTESKEVVGGFALIDVKDRDEAITLTNRFLNLADNATCVLYEVNVA